MSPHFRSSEANLKYLRSSHRVLIKIIKFAPENKLYEIFMKDIRLQVKNTRSDVKTSKLGITDRNSVRPKLDPYL